MCAPLASLAELLPKIVIRSSVIAVAAWIGLSPFSARAQTSAPNVEQSATYVSRIDEDLTIRRVAILPVVDNVDGIYAKPIEAKINELVRGSHRWDLVESNIAGNMPSLLDLEENPSEVQKLVRTIDAEAFIAATASRGPNGLSLRMSLFLKRDGKLLAQAIVKDHSRFEIPGIREQINQMYRKVITKLPYDGLILSRDGQRVTINLGKSDGLEKDQIVTAVQILGMNRHPRFNFIISTDKEILGRIKILKVEDTLSFGAIISEKERGAIRRLAKIGGLEPVNYPVPDRLGDEGGDLSDRPDSPVFGKNPREWLPVRPPSFGLVGVSAGLGSYNSSVNLGGGAGNIEAKAPFYPSLGVYGELWLNPQWTVRADLSQGVISLSNPRAGSTPGTLNMSMTKYSFVVGYNFLLRDDFFGPKLQLSGGFGNYRMFVDDSQPQALTTTNYAGPVIGLSGSFPVTDEKIYYLGGRLNLFVAPSLTETPNRSGASANATVNDFSLFGEMKIAENMRATASVDFSLYSASLTGAGNRMGPANTPESATSLSERHTLITGGIVYMF